MNRPELDPAKFCSHGKTYKTRCIDCELVSAREALSWARDGVDKYSKLIVKLEAEQRLQAEMLVART